MNASEWCRYASPCPCGCGWGMCGIYGDWVERPNCEGCEYEEEMGHEEDQVPVPGGD